MGNHTVFLYLIMLFYTTSPWFDFGNTAGVITLDLGFCWIFHVTHCKSFCPAKCTTSLTYAKNCYYKVFSCLLCSYILWNIKKIHIENCQDTLFLFFFTFTDETAGNHSLDKKLSLGQTFTDLNQQTFLNSLCSSQWRRYSNHLLSDFLSYVFFFFFLSSCSASAAERPTICFIKGTKYFLLNSCSFFFLRCQIRNGKVIFFMKWRLELWIYDKHVLVNTVIHR